VKSNYINIQLRYIPVLLILGVSLFFLSCSSESDYDFSEKGRSVPNPNPDSIYHFVEKQVAFGPRVPNTEAHRLAKSWMGKKLMSYAGNNMVYEQRFSQTVYGDELNMTNIIAAFNPSAKDRIMLCAHWDSRPTADNASVDSLKLMPVIGADDGGSGVAVLLELARNFSKNQPPIGVDIVLFDGEDYGEESDLDHYFLGSRHWANNQIVPNYRPRFGILLDMVGGKDAVFYKERFSTDINGGLVNEIWNLASQLRHDDIFVDERGFYISDDHVVLNNTLPFSTINIVRQQRDGVHKPFADYWHTEFDTMENIDKSTLQAVSEVLLELIYNRIPVSAADSN
jgi:hypothetical protein